jgi:Lambda phage tail tube protein, TTP
MSTTAIAIPAINTLLQYGNGASPEVWTTVANIGDLGGPQMSSTVQDVTSQSTGDYFRRKIQTLLDSGMITAPLYFVPGDAGHQALLEIFLGRSGNTGNPTYWRVLFPVAAGTPQIGYIFQGWLTKFALKEPVAGVIEAAIEVTLTGPPNIPNVPA